VEDLEQARNQAHNRAIPPPPRNFKKHCEKARSLQQVTIILPPKKFQLVAALI